MRKTEACKILAALAAVALLSGCAGRLPTLRSQATVGYTSATHKDLTSLPPPKQKIVVAVYKFRDQTGQYKSSPNVTTFSTAVTQGATSMLIQALQKSGWFIPVEREGLPDLLTERKVVRASREQQKSQAGAEKKNGGNGEAEKKNGEAEKPPSLPPLIFASVILDGGIIAYDSNLVTGAIGAKYFGLGGSAQIRRDAVTVYLRPVAVSNGKILNSVMTSKTILSTMVDVGLFRFVRFKRLFETEAGLSANEPPQMAVVEAIEKAVYSMIIEGILDKSWALENPDDIKSRAIKEYLKEREGGEKVVRFDREGRIVSVVKDTGVNK